MELHSNFCSNVFEEGKKASEKNLQYFKEIKLNLYSTEKCLYDTNTSQNNNNSNGTASIEMILGWRNVAAEINLSIS